jgi:hypothetical protein
MQDAGFDGEQFAPRFPGIEAMGNFRGDTFWPWLSFEVQDDPLRLDASDGSKLNGFGSAVAAATLVALRRRTRSKHSLAKRPFARWSAGLPSGSPRRRSRFHCDRQSHGGRSRSAGTELWSSFTLRRRTGRATSLASSSSRKAKGRTAIPACAGRGFVPKQRKNRPALAWRLTGQSRPARQATVVP